MRSFPLVVRLILRSVIISTGLGFALMVLMEHWGAIRNWAFGVSSALDGKLVAGFILVICGVMWKKGYDSVIWIFSFVRGEEKVIGVICFCVAAGVIVLSGFNAMNVDIWVQLMPVICGVIMFCLPGDDSWDLIDDHYHRGHFVDGVVGFIESLPADVRKIGIMGEWGEGKSHILKMIALRLGGGGEFRVAWINPWHASSQDAAWVEIAKAIDRAMGFPRLIPQAILRLPGLGKVLELLPSPFSGLVPGFKAFLSSGDDLSNSISSGLEEFLRRRNQWMVVFVDDMERVNEDDLRKLFPVVDKLVQMKRCFFIFAIDPDRIAAAFHAKDSPSQEAKGYLEKILDYQITLPKVSRSEAKDFLMARVSDQKSPRLYRALPRLKEFLPDNPRRISRFLREAVGREMMFLDRFGEMEENYEGFFLLLILEIQFPEIYLKIRDERGFFQSMKLSYFYGEGEASKEFDEKFAALIDGVKVRDVKDLKRILGAIHGLRRVMGGVDGEPLLDVEWALDGYQKLLRFSLVDREKFISFWCEGAGSASIGDMIAGVGDFESSYEVGRQALVLEMVAIKNTINEAHAIHYEDGDLSELVIRVRDRIARFESHADAILRGSLKGIDGEVFDGGLFTSWVEGVVAVSLRGLPKVFVMGVKKARIRATARMMMLLSYGEKYQFLRYGYSAILRRADNEYERMKIRGELGRLVYLLEDVVFRELQLMIQRDSIVNVLYRSWVKEYEVGMDDPVAWLSRDGAVARKRMMDLVKLVEVNELLGENMRWVLSNYVWKWWMGDLSDGGGGRQRVRELAVKYPWYIQGLWDAARAEGKSKKLRRLQGERDRVLKIEEEYEGRDEKFIDLLKGLVVR